MEGTHEQKNDGPAAATDSVSLLHQEVYQNRLDPKSHSHLSQGAPMTPQRLRLIAELIRYEQPMDPRTRAAIAADLEEHARDLEEALSHGT